MAYLLIGVASLQAAGEHSGAGINLAALSAIASAAPAMRRQPPCQC